MGLIETFDREVKASVPFTLSPDLLDEAAELFLELSEEDSFRTRFQQRKLRPESRGSERGYFWKKSGKSYPTKTEYFHFSDHIEFLFPDEIRQARKKEKKFLRLARIIYDESISVMEEAISELNETFPGTYQRFFPENQRPEFLTRFLKYNKEEGHENLNQPHFDLGPLTLRIRESSPGLLIGHDFPLQEAPYKEGFADLMPGSVLHHICPGIKPVLHKVVQDQDKYLSGKVARWAIVSFSAYTNMPEYSNKEIHPQEY